MWSHLWSDRFPFFLTHWGTALTIVDSLSCLSGDRVQGRVKIIMEKWARSKVYKRFPGSWYRFCIDPFHSNGFYSVVVNEARYFLRCSEVKTLDKKPPIDPWLPCINCIHTFEISPRNDSMIKQAKISVMIGLTLQCQSAHQSATQIHQHQYCK